MKRLSVSIFLLLAFTFMGLAPDLLAGNVSPNSLREHVVAIKRNCGEGTIDPIGSQVVTEGDNLPIKIAPAVGYKVDYITVDNVSIDLANDARYDATTNTLTLSNITTNQTVVVCFVSDVETYIIRATANAGGSIATAEGAIVSPTERRFPVDATPTYTIVPDDNATIQYVIVDGDTVDIANPSTDTRVTWSGDTLIFKFEAVTANRTIEVVFETESTTTRYNVTLNIVYADANDNCVTTTPAVGATQIDSGKAYTATFTVGTDGVIDSVVVDGTINADAIANGEVTIASVEKDIVITIYATCPEGIIELTIPSLLITPNPVENKAVITKDANITFTKIEVINIMGDIVITINNPTDVLDMNSLAKGNYIVRFYTNDGFTVRNIIKR